MTIHLTDEETEITIRALDTLRATLDAPERGYERAILMQIRNRLRLVNRGG